MELVINIHATSRFQFSLNLVTLTFSEVILGQSYWEIFFKSKSSLSSTKLICRVENSFPFSSLTGKLEDAFPDSFSYFLIFTRSRVYLCQFSKDRQMTSCFTGATLEENQWGPGCAQDTFCSLNFLMTCFVNDPLFDDISHDVEYFGIRILSSGKSKNYKNNYYF